MWVHDLEKDLIFECRSNVVLGWSLMGQPLVDASEAIQLSDSSHSTTAQNIINAGKYRSCPYCAVATQWDGSGEGWGEWSAVMDKVKFHLRLSFIRNTAIYSGSKLGFCLFMNPTVLRILLHLVKCPSAGKGKNTQRKPNSLGLNLGLWIQQLGIRPNFNGWWWPLRRWEVSLHTECWIQLLHI